MAAPAKSLIQVWFGSRRFGVAWKHEYWSGRLGWVLQIHLGVVQNDGSALLYATLGVKPSLQNTSSARSSDMTLAFCQSRSLEQLICFFDDQNVVRAKIFLERINQVLPGVY